MNRVGLVCLGSLVEWLRGHGCNGCAHSLICRFRKAESSAAPSSVAAAASSKPEAAVVLDAAATQRAAQATFDVEPAWVAEVTKPSTPLVVPGTT